MDSRAILIRIGTGLDIGPRVRAPLEPLCKIHGLLAYQKNDGTLSTESALVLQSLVEMSEGCCHDMC